MPEIGYFLNEFIRNSLLWLTWETDLTVDWSFSMLNSCPLHWSLRSAITRSLASKFAEAVSQDKFLAARSACAASKSLLIVSIWFWYDTIWLLRSVCDLVRSGKKYCLVIKFVEEWVGNTDKRPDVWSRPLCIYTQIFSPKKTCFSPIKNTFQNFFDFCLPLFYATFQYRP